MDRELRDEIISLFITEPASDEARRRAETAVERLASILDLPAWRSAESHDDLLAFLAASRLDLPEGHRDEVEALFDELVSMAPSGGGARSRWATLTDRMSALDSASNAAEHFERLSGRRPGSPDRVSEPTAAEDAHVMLRSRDAAPPRAGVSGPRRPLYLVRLLSAAAVVVLLVGVTGRIAESRLAHDAHTSLMQAAAHRGATRSGSSVEQSILSADPIEAWSRRASSGRRLRLGLWPSYDTAVLEGVENDIVSARDTSAAALLILAKVRLMLGDEDGARSVLEQATRGGSPEAAEWIRRLTTEGARP